MGVIEVTRMKTKCAAMALKLKGKSEHWPVNNTNVLILQPRGENGRIDGVMFLDARIQKDFKLGASSVFWYPSDPVDPRRLMLGAKLRF